MKAWVKFITTYLIVSTLAILLPTAVVHSAASTLVAVEAFLDDPDLTPGDGTPLSLDGDPNQALREGLGAVDLTQVPAGVHTVYVRFLDDHGDWSIPVGQSFYIPEGSQGSGNNIGGANKIQTAEAYFDTDPGSGSGVPVAIPADGTIDASLEVLLGNVDLTGVTPGLHTIYVRFQDQAGVWSSPIGQPVYITPELIGSTGGANLITTAQYQIDGGAFQTATAQDGVFDSFLEVVDTTLSASNDYHTFRVRFQNSAGHWSQHQPSPPPVFVDLDSDNLPDSWEQQWFGTFNTDADSDPDNDGLTNLQEYQQGSDPLVSDNLAGLAISGLVLDDQGIRMPNIILCISGIVPFTCPALTDSFGHFVLGASTVLTDGDYTVTPQSSTLIFTPPSRQVTLNGSNVSTQDFSAEPIPAVTPPSATIDCIVPVSSGIDCASVVNPVIINSTVGEIVEFAGFGTSNTTQPIELYHWSAAKLIDGIEQVDRLDLGTTETFLTDQLPTGDWRIYLQVATDDGVWSEPATTDIVVADDTGLPDLAIDPASIQYFNEFSAQIFGTQPGDQVTISLDALNLGDIDALDEAILSIYEGEEASGELIAQTTIAQIGAQGSETVNLPWHVGYRADGTLIANYQEEYKVLTAIIEFTNNVPEITAQNNQATSFAVVGDPAPGTYGINLNVAANGILYAGRSGVLSGSASYQWGSGLPVMGALVTVKLETGATFYTHTTAPSGRYAVSINLPPAAGNYLATVTVYDQNLSAVKKVTLNMQPVPQPETWHPNPPSGSSTPPPAPAPATDLFVNFIGFSGEGVYSLESNLFAAVPGSTVNVSAQIKNNGGLGTTNSFTVSIYGGDPDSGGLLLTTKTINGLAAGETASITSTTGWSLGTEIGAKSAYVVVDENNSVEESHEYNNKRARGILIRPKRPDLKPFYRINYSTISGLYSSAVPIVGQPVTLFADVYNNGSGNFAGGTSVDFYLGDPGRGGESIGSDTISSPIAKDGKGTASISWTPSADGSQAIYAVVDETDIILEDNETNNRTSRSFAVISDTALVCPTDLNFSNNAPRTNTQITITAFLNNKGAVASNDETVEFYLGNPLDGGISIGSSNSGVIAGQGRETVTIDWITPDTPELSRVYAVVGACQYYRDLNITNNPPPDLNIFSSSIGLSPLRPSTGDDVSVWANISNQSPETTSNGFQVNFYLDSAIGLVPLGSSVAVGTLAPGASVRVDATALINIDQPFYVLLVQVIPNVEQGDANLGDNAATRSFGNADRGTSVTLTGVNPSQTVYQPGEIVLAWQTSDLPANLPIINLSMQRDSFAHLIEPDGINWYEFKVGTANDNSEPVIIPAGLSQSSDWRFVVQETETGLSDKSAQAFSYQEPVESLSPVVTLSGNNTLRLNIGDTFTDPVVQAIDDIDGDISANVSFSGNVDTSTAGTYYRVYSVTDSSGNQGSVTLEVLVTGSIGGVSGVPGYIKEENHNSQSLVSDPINTASGAHYIERTVLAVNGAKSIILQLRYDSLLLNEGVVGKAWAHNYETYVDEFAEGGINVYWNTNQSNSFWRNDQGNYTSNDFSTRFDTLTKNPDGSYTLSRQDNTTYLFNNAGQLQEIQDRQGKSLLLTYDASNLLQTVTEPISGKALIFNYNAAGLLETVTDPLNRQITFAYDSSNNLTQLIDAKGHSTTYTYNADGRVLNAVDGEGIEIFVNTYDAEGRVASQNDAVAGNGLTLFSYNESTNPAQVTTTITNRNGDIRIFLHDNNYNLLSIHDELGNAVASYTYDENGQRISATDANGNSRQFGYDERGNLTTITDAAGHVSTLIYDTSGNITSVTNAEGKATIFTYDSSNNLLSVLDPLGNQTNYSYDANGLLQSITRPNAGVISYGYENGLVKTVTNAAGVTLTLGYDASGRVTSMTDPEAHTTTLEYDNQGNISRIQNPLGNVVQSTYNSHGDLLTTTDPKGNVTQYSYNGNGKLVSLVNALTHESRYEYDGEDRLIRIIDARGNASTLNYDAKGQLTGITDALGNTQSLSYDPAGNLPSVKDAKGNSVLSLSYDNLNNPTSSTDALGQTTAVSYDTLNRATQVTDPDNRTTQFGYDNLNRLVSSVDAMLGTSGQSFDSNGNLTSLTDPNGNVTQFGYDQANRLTSEMAAWGATTAYQYNASGLLSKVTNGRSQVRQIQYNAAGRIATYTDPEGTVSFSYDANGNILTVTDNQGTISRQYDALNRITQYTDVQGNIMSYAYDAAGNLTSLTNPGGRVVQYGYDTANRLTTVTDWANRITRYSYDVNGRVVKEERPNGTVLTRTYNVAGQLLQQKDVDSGGNIISQYDFSYDAVGNVLSEQSATPPEAFSLPQTTMTYGSGNRLATYNGENVIFDADGNMTTGPLEGVMVTYQFDARNRLTDTSSMGYQYDAENNRIATTENGQTTLYAINPNAILSQVLIRTAPDGTQTYYVYGLGMIGQEENGEYLSYHSDRRGSTVALTDSNGNVVERFQYAPFGGLASRTVAQTVDTPFLYNGRDGVMKDGNGLYYMRARYYEPRVGRFVSKDLLLGKVNYGATLNEYAYVISNPIMLVDPRGMTGQDSDKKDNGSPLEDIIRDGSLLIDAADYSVKLQKNINLLNAKNRLVTMTPFVKTGNQLTKIGKFTNAAGTFGTVITVGFEANSTEKDVEQYIRENSPGLGEVVAVRAASLPTAVTRILFSIPYDLSLLGSNISLGAVSITDNTINRLIKVDLGVIDSLKDTKQDVLDAKENMERTININYFFGK